jgi:putative ABC transport system substrate-binding protein
MASYIGRRKFLATLGGAAAVARPLTARAQQADRVRRIGVLAGSAEDDTEGQARLAALREGLQKLGWTEGHNIKIDDRWAGADLDRLRAAAAELVAMAPDLLFAVGSAATAALRQATSAIPIVFAQVTDPLVQGFVASTARPGGNITGFALYEHTIAVKWLELLKQLAPHVVRVVVIYPAANPLSIRYLRAIEGSAASMGVEVFNSALSDSAEIGRAIGDVAVQANGGVIVLPGPHLPVHREQITALANRHRAPSVYAFRYWVTAGGLASYGVDNTDLYRRAASYVDRILKGEKPGELPVQFANKFELVINLKTAKALGLDPPITLLARTDEVIE